MRVAAMGIFRLTRAATAQGPRSPAWKLQNRAPAAVGLPQGTWEPISASQTPDSVRVECL